MLGKLTLTTPEWLWLSPLALFVAWWWARQPRPAVKFSDVAAFGTHIGFRARASTWGGAVLRALACLALVVALAGPRVPDERTQLPAEGIAIMMAVDISGSMDSVYGPWNPGGPDVSRLEAARRAFELFVAGGEAPDGTRFDPRHGDAVGLVTFAAVPQTACPLTFNHTVVIKVLKGLEPKGGLDAGTNIGDALVEGMARLAAVNNRKGKVLILLSDGSHNITLEDDGPGPRRPGIERTMLPREAAQLAANLDIKIYIIDAGGEPPPPPPGAPPEKIADWKAEVEKRREGQKTLQDVAEMSRGKAFAATSGPELLAAYREISQLEKTVEDAPIYRRYFEFYPWCAGAALVFLLLAHILDRTALRVVT